VYADKNQVGFNSYDALSKVAMEIEEPLPLAVTVRSWVVDAPVLSWNMRLVPYAMFPAGLYALIVTGVRKVLTTGV
jgi:hypothetical protein